MIGNSKSTQTVGFENTMKQVIGAGGHFAEAAKDSARHLKSTVSHALEDGMTSARRMARRGRYAAEDLLDQTAHGIKRHPFKAMAMSVGIGVGLGAMTMWLARRNGRR